MIIIRRIFVAAIILAACYGWYYRYSILVKNERAAEAEYVRALKMQQSKPPAKVRVIDVGAVSYDDPSSAPRPARPVRTR